MYCNGCGTQLADGSNYCHSCGKSQGGRQPAEARSPTAWEFCEIEMVTIKRGRYLFVDEGWRRYFVFAAIKYGAGDSKVEIARSSVCKGVSGTGGYPCENHAAQQTLKEIVGDLTSAGWQYTNTGTRWFSNKFRRPVA